MDRPTGGFARQFLSGSIWIMLRLLGRQAVQSLAFFAFAYFMTPGSFGIAAMATSLGFLGRLVVERGVRDRVIQRETHDAATLSTAFWLAIGLGIAMTALLAAIGMGIVMLNADLGGPGPFLAAACVPLLIAPSRVHEGLVRRDFGFRRLAVLQMAVSLAALGISFALLLLGAQIWAVVIFVLADSAGLTLALWLGSAFRPGLRYDHVEAAEQMRFSGAVIFGAILTVGNLRIIEIALGVALGPASAGFFRLGVQVNRLLTQMLRTPVNNMVLPSFARMSNRAEIAARLIDVSVVSALVTLPAFVLAAAGSPMLIELVMGAEWRPAGVAAQWICLGIYAQFLPPIVNPALIAVGRPLAATRLAAVIFATSLVFVMAGAAAFDLSGATIGYAAGVVVILPYALRVMRAEFALSAAAVLRPLAAPTLASLAAFAVAVALLAAAEGPATLRLCLALGAGAALYLVLVLPGMHLLDRGRLARLRRTLGRRRSG